MSDKKLTFLEEVAIAKNRMLDSAVTLVDAVDLGVIYTMFFSPVLHQFLEEIGRYFLFPIAAAAHGIKMILSWRHAYLSRGAHNSIPTAIVETIVFAGIATAVIGALVSGYFTTATPIIFTAMVGGKALYHAGSTIYYAGKASATNDPAEKTEYRDLAKKNGVIALAGSVATAAVAAVFVFGKIGLAALGVVAAVMVAAIAVFIGYKAYKASIAPQPVSAVEDQPSPDSTLSLSKGMGLTADDLRTSQTQKPTSTVVNITRPASPKGTHKQVNDTNYQQDKDNEPLLSAQMGK